MTRHTPSPTANAQDVTADAGTFACPICGKDTPHYHSPEEVKEHRDTEAWVEESWQQIRPIIFPDSAQDVTANGTVPYGTMVWVARIQGLASHLRIIAKECEGSESPHMQRLGRQATAGLAEAARYCADAEEVQA